MNGIASNGLTDHDSNDGAEHIIVLRKMVVLLVWTKGWMAVEGPDNSSATLTELWFCFILPHTVTGV